MNTKLLSTQQLARLYNLNSAGFASRDHLERKIAEIEEKEVKVKIRIAPPKVKSIINKQEIYIKNYGGAKKEFRRRGVGERIKRLFGQSGR